MIKAALVGNPNVGKTTLFNYLTGSNQYVGNWAGVTVEKKEGFYKDKAKIVDLPGIYALDTYSNEEKVSKDYLINGDVDVILNIIDGTNLVRNLYLTLQLKEFNKPIVLIVNMVDELKTRGVKIDYSILAERLGVVVVPISASSEIGLDELEKLLEGSDFFKTSIENNYQYENEKDAYNFLEEVFDECVSYDKGAKQSVTDKIDSFVLNKYLSFPIFFGILFLIFEMTFSVIGQPLADLLDSGLNNVFIPFVESLLVNTSPWFKSLLVDGIIGGVGSVIVFFPIVITLFLGISFLEDSGYMARAAIIMDRFMRYMGLSGKAFIPLIVGFGCSVPGIMSARTLESEKDRKLTALIVPFMSCNARLPVYALFAAAIFPGNKSLLVFSLYITGILVAFLMGILFKRTIFKKDEEPFLIELPEYKLPKFKHIMNNTWDKGKDFIKKAGTLIFSMSVLIWVLSNFNFSGMTEMETSLLAGIGRFIAPVFKPLGFNTWENSVALLSGFIAKEVIVGTLGVLHPGNLELVLPSVFTKASAISFLVFTLLYTPCIAVVATMKKEYGNKMAIFSVVYQLVVAWIIAFIVYNGANFLMG